MINYSLQQWKEHRRVFDSEQRNQFQNSAAGSSQRLSKGLSKLTYPIELNRTFKTLGKYYNWIVLLVESSECLLLCPRKC